MSHLSVRLSHGCLIERSFIKAKAIKTNTESTMIVQWHVNVYFWLFVMF